MLNAKVQLWPTRKQFELLNIHAMELCTMSAVEDKRYNLKTEGGGRLGDSQLHPEGGSLSFSELDQLLTQTFNERLLLLCLQNQQ